MPLPRRPARSSTSRTRRGWSAALPLSLLLAAVPAGAQQGGPWEPAVGTVERRSILDALRKTGDVPDRVFVIRSMKVQNGWAWVVVDPESRDRLSRYETESALLRGAAETWTVVDRPCEEDGCDPRREVERIKAAHPDVPASILPP